ncbi:unnamed protein product [Microthlaspi erraticum]|uniref:F-box domain-containing protein n=1 Tax=Microthlaspi erraticum TaxID=1685480 RepID=A0A6D2HC14_9BRAS|nr:unnamed protein product [Microthlaspi erraticum]
MRRRKRRMSNLPSELVEEIISRVQMKYMGIVRSTCKTWNSFFQDPSFVKKHIGQAAASTRERGFLMITRDDRVQLISVNLNENHKNKDFDLSINRKGALRIGGISDHVVYNISQVFHCNGLWLCVSSNIRTRSRVVVWSPYWGNTRWIDDRKDDWGLVQRFAFGYDKSCGSYKILKWFLFHHLKIFNLSNNSWKIHNVTLDLVDNIEIGYRQQGVSLKGNTYWHAGSYQSRDAFLLCFDFTREKFGPRLPLPSGYKYECEVYLSAVREEKLLVLIRPWRTYDIKVWITNKIEPDAVSWTNFLKVDITPQVDIMFQIKSFFIDEEKKIAVVFGEIYNSQICSIAFIIGENGYFRRVDLGMFGNIQLHPFVYSYAPNSLQIK